MTILNIFKSRIQVAERILITTHEYPDADGIGSEIALCLALQEYGKKCYCVNELSLLERYRYLDKNGVVHGLKEFQELYPHFSPDLVIVVDTNTKLRIGPKLGQFIHPSVPILYIDHHPSRGKIFPEHCLDVSAAATGQIVGEVIESLGIKFSHEIALPLYTAIIIDTSSFRYPTVSSATHRLVAKLMATGISPPEAYNGIYGTKSVHHMHLLGTILRTACLNSSGTVAWIILRKEDIDRYGTDIEDTHAFINNLLILNNIKVACMFRDDGHQVKLSLRSAGDYDVGEIALALGGGGHSHSAATLLIRNSGEDLEKIITKAIQKVEDVIISMDQDSTI